MEASESIPDLPMISESDQTLSSLQHFMYSMLHALDMFRHMCHVNGPMTDMWSLCGVGTLV